jgi:hypothetical protein
MAEQAYSADRNAKASQFGVQAQFGMRALWRLAIWGCLAAFAVFAAIISAYSNVASQRPVAAVTSSQKPSGQASSGQASSGQASSGQATPDQAALNQVTPQARTLAGEAGTRSSETAEETRRLTEAVRALAADQDRVLARIAALERNLDGVTGSIKRDRMAGPQPTPNPSLNPSATTATTQVTRSEMPVASATTAPVTIAPVTAAPVMETTTTPAQGPASPQTGASDAAQTAAPDASHHAAASPSIQPHAPTPAEPAAAPAEPLAAAGGLGVDIGGATNYEGLRTLWHSTQNSDPALLEELYPVVAVRENSKTHGIDLRLLAGPLADADAAARLCATLSAARHYCQPVAFEGQRLPLNETATAKVDRASTKAATRHAAPSPSAQGPSAPNFAPETPHFHTVIGK